MSDNVILSTLNLNVTFGGKKSWLRAGTKQVNAVNNVNIQLYKGEILGLAGESGSGKSTLGRTLLGIQRETSGEIFLNQKPVFGLSVSDARIARNEIQYIHQDPGAALDPWWTIGHSLKEGLQIHGVIRGEADKRIITIIENVGLELHHLARYPHEMSGGQLRRVGIARVLLLRPKIVIFDEPTSGLDLSVQNMVLKLMLSAQKKYQLTYIFISHDLSVTRQICDRVAIMRNGKIVELEASETLFTKPQHSYTKALLTAVPKLELVT